MTGTSAATGYDVVILGAEVAGSVLAGRVSEDPDRSVWLVEAGPASACGRTHDRRCSATPAGPSGQGLAAATHAWRASFGDLSRLWDGSGPMIDDHEPSGCRRRPG